MKPTLRQRLSWVTVLAAVLSLTGMAPQAPADRHSQSLSVGATAAALPDHVRDRIFRLKGRPPEEVDRELQAIREELEATGWLARPRPASHQIPGGPYVGYPVFFGVSKPLTEIEPLQRPPQMRPKPPWMERARDFLKHVDPDLLSGDAEGLYVVPHLPIRSERPAKTASGMTLPTAPSPSPPSPGPALTPGPFGSFEGLSNYDNLVTHGFQVLPPDVNGDVGPDQYVEFINLVLAVYDKNGNKLAGPLTLSQIFASAGSTGPCALTDDGDTIVLYDQEFDQWILSQFQVTFGPPFSQCIAVSVTGNAAGPYFVYEYTMPNNYFNDYPHFGIWSTAIDFGAYFMTDHEFGGFGGLPPCPNPASVYCGQGVFAFDRLAMALGDPSPPFVYFGSTATPPSGVDLKVLGGVLAADWDGSIFPPSDSCTDPGIFLMFDADEFGAPADRLRIFRFRPTCDATWMSCDCGGAPADFFESASSPIPVAAFNPLNPSGRDDIPQPAVDPTRFLDSISDRLMHRVVFRRFSTSIFPDNKSWIGLNHTVCVNANPADCTVAGSYRAGVRWYILALDNANPDTITLQDQGTHAPPDGVSRWMASVAINRARDFCVSYSASSGTLFPSIRYACRTVYDPSGTLRDEAVLINGNASQSSTASRWGDYSMLSVDPVDELTFFPIHEYYTTNNPPGCSLTACWHTRFGKFRLQWDIRGAAPVTFGFPSDTPVPADYNGDGKADIAVVRNMGTFLRWFISGVGTFDFGKPGDVPVPADYDGDGKADIAVFRPSTGQWFIFGVGTFTFGTSTDKPVPADYNGDGKADIAVFRPSTGQWFIFGVGTFTWGTAGDALVPADYDGDGKADIAVFRK